MASEPLGASCATLAGRATSGRQAGRALWTEIVEVVLTWLERTRQRRHLSQFNDHMLKDIGLSRSEAESEISKPFWRA
jgi:uncharacterized protein YjiS (DUF1127 family)